jgi:hypothetical protein
MGLESSCRWRLLFCLPVQQLELLRERELAPRRALAKQDVLAERRGPRFESTEFLASFRGPSLLACRRRYAQEQQQRGPVHLQVAAFRLALEFPQAEEFQPVLEFQEVPVCQLVERLQDHYPEELQPHPEPEFPEEEFRLVARPLHHFPQEVVSAHRSHLSELRCIPCKRLLKTNCSTYQHPIGYRF